MTLAYPHKADARSDDFMALFGLDQAALDALPQAAYLCAGDGAVVRFNQKAAELWGRAPHAGDRFCGGARLYRTDGAPLPHDQCPMAVALRTGRSFQNQELVIEQPDGQRLTVLVNIGALKDEEGRVNGAINFFQDITDRKRAEKQQLLVLGEMSHRIKNVFALAASVCALGARSSGLADEAVSDIQERLSALARAHDLTLPSLAPGDFRAETKTTLHALIQAMVAPHECEGSFFIEGPDLSITGVALRSLALFFHEATTNAVKYGALSSSTGRIEVKWRIEKGAFLLSWRETGGPRVDEPQNPAGFGSTLSSAAVSQLGGGLSRDWDPDGLRMNLVIPLSSLIGEVEARLRT